jgi:lysophospholipase L1-like esterase
VLIIATKRLRSILVVLAIYQCGDNLHPSDAGYRAMADAIDLSLFGVRESAANLR